MKTCWVSKKAFAIMRQEARTKHPLETGGCLMGYVGKNGEAVVTDIVGPGPKAIHKHYSFEGDYAWQNKRVGELYDSSERSITYLGDWHTHPANSPLLSDIDIKCLIGISENKEARCPNPLMLILGFDFSFDNMSGFEYPATNCPLIISPLNIKAFD